MWFAESRTTENVDLVGLRGTAEERYALMDLALECGLPIEALNSAADYFVRRIEGWRDHLEVLVRGPRATIYRPDATLFLVLKIGRLTESDLDDCAALIAFAERERLDVDRPRVLMALDALPPAENHELAERRMRVARALGRGQGRG